VHEREFSYHMVTLVNLSRPYKEDTESPPAMCEDTRRRIGSMYRDRPELRNVRLEHYKGGPVNTNTICKCIVPGAHRRGWDVFDSLRDAIVRFFFWCVCLYVRIWNNSKLVFRKYTLHRYTHMRYLFQVETMLDSLVLDRP
jgi:hypothetical protein